MDQTLDKIKQLRRQIDQLKQEFKRYHYIVDAMQEETNTYPQELLTFIESLPNNVNKRITEELDSEFCVIRPKSPHKPPKTRIGVINGIRI